MGFWSSLTGSDAADASKAAAADTYQKQQGAVGKLLGYGEDYKAGYDKLGDSYAPYAAKGDALSGSSNDALLRLINDPSSVRSLPSYQFDQAEGTRAVDRSAGARGMDASGRTLKDLTRFGTGLADRTYGDQLSRLLGINREGFTEGMSATGAGNAAYGQGLQGELGARTTAYGGLMGSAGTVGQGDIAAANARAAGSQNILNTGVKLAGMAVGGFGGGNGLNGLMGYAQSGTNPFNSDGTRNSYYGRG